MSDQDNDDTGTPATPPFSFPPEPQPSVFYGYSPTEEPSVDDWPNSLSIGTAEGYNPAADTPRPPGFDYDPEQQFADRYGNVGLVLIDTNYKPTRTGEHPVRLTRTDAAQAAAALIENIQHTIRGGKLRASETVELLTALQSVDSAVFDLRDQLIYDMTSNDDNERSAE